MLTNDLSNNNISTSPPPPPGWKNTCKHNDKDGKSPSVTAEKSSSGNKPRRDQSKNPVQQSSLNFAENPLFKKKQEEHNVNSETADEGSNIRKSEKNRSSTPKPVSPRILSPQQDNGNSNKPSGTNNSTQSEKGPSENPTQLATEQKIDTPILINTLVEISKTAALKYSIATLLLCISSVTAGIYTYLSISVTLSDPVLFTVIAFVSALVMLSLAAYLINSHLSAINSEKGVDPGRKQSQDLQKAKELEHSNTPTSSLPVMSGTPSAPPPPPPPPSTPVKSNDLSTELKNSPSDANQKDVQQKQSGTPVDARRNLLADIKKGVILKPVTKDGLKIPQKQEEESVAEKRENGVQTLNQNQSQNSDSQAAKKLEHSKSEDMQQMNSLAIAIQKQRGKSGFQDEQLDSLDENDHQEDSLFCLEEEQFKPASQEQKKCVQQPDAALSILKDKCMETKFLQPESPINNLSSNSGNAPDYGDWETEPQSIAYIYCDRTRQERRKEKGASPSATKGSGADQVSNEVQKSSTVSVKEQIKNFQGLNK